MRRDIRKQGPPEPPGLRQRLQEARSPLLALHKTLVQSERVEYEKTMGKIRSPNHFLQLLLQDPWFAWLSPLSQLIVSIDELLDGKEPMTTQRTEALLKQAAGLLAPSDRGHDFARHYYEALQRDPDVVMAHADWVKLRRGRTT